MDVRILIAAFCTLASAAAITVTDTPPTENPFVPGVFIAADALKSLQDKAKPDGNGNQGETPPTVTRKNDQLSSTPNMSKQPNQGYPMQEQMNQPMGNTQYMPNQMGNQQYMPNQQPPYSNQQLYPNQQPMLNQPQYGNQPQGYGNQPQPYGNQQGMLLMNQPGYNQPNGLGSQGYLLNNPSYQQPGLLNQQPYQNFQGVLYQQPSYNQQPMVAQPNTPLFVPNGQLARPNMVTNPNLGGQPMITNNPGNTALYTNTVQNPGNLYAMIPVNNAGNGQNTVPNPNLGNNNNAYFVPIQQMPANTVVLRDTAKK